MAPTGSLRCCLVDRNQQQQHNEDKVYAAIHEMKPTKELTRLRSGPNYELATHIAPAARAWQFLGRVMTEKMEVYGSEKYHSEFFHCASMK